MNRWSVTEDARNLVGACADECVIELIVDHSFQRHVPVIDDDMYRRQGPVPVARPDRHSR